MQRHMCLVGHYVSPFVSSFIFLVAVVATPAATVVGVAIVVSKTGTVAAVASSLVALSGCALVGTESTESTVLGVQLRVAAEGLSLLTLERGDTALSLGLSGDAVGSGPGAILGEGRARSTGLGGF